MEFWVDVAGVLGFLLSVGTVIHTLRTQRRRLSMRVCAANLSEGSLVLFMQFENRSRLPIAVTRVRIDACGSLLDCTAVPKIAYYTYKSVAGVVVSNRDFYTMPLPVEIDCLGAASGFLLFESLPEDFEIQATPITFLIATNRGREFQTKLSLEDCSPISK